MLQGPEVNKQDVEGYTALMIAAGKGQVDCLKELIAAGAEVNKQDVEGYTALMIAAGKGQVDCLKELIAAGAEVNKQDVEGYTALMIAAGKGQVDCLKELIAAGAEVNKKNKKKTALTFAAACDYIDCIKVLITAGADGNIYCRETPQQLMKAVDASNIDYLTWLLNAGANVNTTDENGNTALINAVKMGNKPIVQILVDWEADVNVENDDGETALYHAVSQGHKRFGKQYMDRKNKESSLIVYILLRAGAHIHKTKSDLNPSTIHMDSTSFGEPNPYILKLLLAAGANIMDNQVFPPKILLRDYACDCIRETLKQNNPEWNLYCSVSQLELPPNLQSQLLLHTVEHTGHVLSNEEEILFQKITEGDAKSVQYLIDAKIDVNVQNENGMTPVMVACQAGHAGLVEELLRAKADVNIQALSGDTALIYAAEQHNQECLFALLDNGASPNISNHNGCSALILSANCLKCVQKLIAAGAEVNAMDANGKTPITNAAGAGNIDCIKHFIESGADVNNQNGFHTALMAAAENNHLDCLKLLIQEGADLNIQDADGYTALMKASLQGFSRCFNALFKSGAEIDMTFMAVNVTRKQLNLNGDEGKINSILINSNFHIRPTKPSLQDKNGLVIFYYVCNKYRFNKEAVTNLHLKYIACVANTIGNHWHTWLIFSIHVSQLPCCGTEYLDQVAASDLVSTYRLRWPWVTCVWCDLYAFSSRGGLHSMWLRRGPCPPTDQNFLNFMRQTCKNYMLALPGGGLVPILWKSWLDDTQYLDI